MKFFVDESTGQGIANYLREEGHDVLSAIETFQGHSDKSILEQAYKKKRIVITNDKDFGELIYRHQYPCEGVIFLRLQDERYLNKLRVLKNVLKKWPDGTTGYFIVANEQKIRKRPISD